MDLEYGMWILKESGGVYDATPPRMVLVEAGTKYSEFVFFANRKQKNSLSSRAFPFMDRLSLMQVTLP